MRKYQQRRHSSKDISKVKKSDSQDNVHIKNYKGVTIISTFGTIDNLDYDVDKLLYKIKRKIDSILDEVEIQERIVIVDKYGNDICVEVYEKKNDADYIQLIINKLEDFLKNNLIFFASQFVF